jgi:hypothetical protein
MERDLAATVDVDDGCAVEGPLVRLRAAAGGEHRWVLHQQHSVLGRISHPLRVQLPLLLPGVLVFDEAEPLHKHLVSLTLWTMPPAPPQARRLLR